MRKINLDNMDKLIKFLKTLKENQFNFREVVSDSQLDEEDNICGTVCCAVGWFPAIFKEVKWDIFGINMGGGLDDFPGIAEVILGIEEDVSEYLFTPYDQYKVHTDLVQCGKEATALEVVAMLEHFVQLVKEGKIEGHEV